MQVVLDSLRRGGMLGGVSAHVHDLAAMRHVIWGCVMPVHDPTVATTLSVVRFGYFEADLESGQLRKRGVKLPLREQSFQVLACLLEHPGQVVTREDLRQRLWRDEVFVDFERGLNTIIARLRAVLSDAAEHPRFIETLPRRGYRFIAPVTVLPARAAEREPRRLRLIVLPFLNLTGDSSQEYLSDAMTDEIITALAPLAPDRLAVLARTTSMHYKGSDKNVGRIGRELAVDYVLEGTVRRVGQAAELNVQLISAADETHIFAKRYTVSWRDLFHCDARVAADLAQHLGIPSACLSPEALAAGAAPGRYSRDLLAYREYIQGRAVIIGTAASFDVARQHFQNAIDRDPEFAQAHDALAEIYWYLGYFGFVSPRRAFSTGILHALRALEIDNTRAETHALLGQFHKTLEYNWAEVHREMALALRLDPSSPVVRIRYALSELMPHGRLDEAVAELERGLEFDPLSQWARFWLGIVLTLGRGYERAVEECRKLLELDPVSVPANFVMGICCRYLNRCDEAIAHLQKTVELSGGVSSMLGWLGLTLASCGRTGEARAVLSQLQHKAAHGYVSPASIAWVYLGLRELDHAFEWMDRAVEDCDQLMMPIKTYGFLEPLRTDPRYLALLRKMNLADA